MVIRKYLSGARRGKKKELDMQKIYDEIDSGRTVSEVAKEWGVSRSTLYNRHDEYKTLLELQQKNEKELVEKNEEKQELPMIHDDALLKEYYQDDEEGVT